MPPSDRFVHRLAIVTPTVIEDVDDYGQPIAGPPSVEIVRGFLYPMSANEQSQVNEAGAIVADHNVLFDLRDVPEAGYIRFEPDDGERYEIQSVQDYRFSNHPLTLVRVHRVSVETPVAAGS